MDYDQKARMLLPRRGMGLRINRWAFLALQGVGLRFLLLWLGLSCATTVLAGADTCAVFDFRNGNSTARATHKLQGYAEFYWQKLVDPSDFNARAVDTPTMVRIPDTWTHYWANGHPLPPEGCATYRFFILPPAKSRPEELLAFRLPVIYSSYRFWVNGTLLASVGRVANNPFGARSKPAVLTLPVPLNAADSGHTADTLECVLQVANYSYARAGIRHNILFGPMDKILLDARQEIRGDFLTLGILLVLIVFYGLMDRAAYGGLQGLWMVATGLLLAAHTLSESSQAFLDLFPNLSWTMLNVARYMPPPLAVACSLIFVRQRFPREVNFWALLPLASVGVVASVLIAILSPAIFSEYKHSITLYGLVSILFLVLGVLTRAIRHRKPQAWPITLGLLGIFACITADAIYLQLGAESPLKLGYLGLFLLFAILSLPLMVNLVTQARRRAERNIAQQAEIARYQEEEARLVEERNEECAKAATLQEEIRTQHWIEAGYTGMENTLTKTTREMTAICKTSLEMLAKYVEANVAALYVARLNPDTMGIELHLTADQALTQAQRDENSLIMQGEGLIGGCYTSNAMQHITDLPEHFLQISSGLGQCAPPAILLLPMEADTGSVGVVALGRFTPFLPHEIALIRRCVHMVSNAVMGIRSGEDNIHALEDANREVSRLRHQLNELGEANATLEAQVNGLTAPQG